MKRSTTIFLALSLALNLVLGGFLAYQYIGLPTAAASNHIKAPGTYGPPAMEILDGDTTISTSEVTLQNTLITGNLYLTAEVDSGVVSLRQVEVQGEVIISGGGNYDLLLFDTTLAKLSVQDNEGAVTIIAKGASSINTVEIGAEASIQEEALADGSLGFKNVRIVTDKKVILLGDFTNLDILTKANLKLLKGSAASVSLKDGGANTSLELAPGVEVDSLVLEAVLSLSGNGSVNTVELNAPGLTRLQGNLSEVSCRAGGIFLEFQAGSIEKLLVPPLEVATSIALAEDTYVANLELNSRTGVTGPGQIGTAIINHGGITLDQTPDKVIISQDMTAIIAGEEYRAEPEPEPTPEPTPEPEPKPDPNPSPSPEPPKPSVSINSISNLTLLAGETGTRVINITPADAGLTVTSSNTGVATVSLSGKTVTVTAKGSGTATITVKGTKSGYTSATRTFKVTVNGLTDVKDFRVETGISPGKSLVIVTLWDPNPSKYVGKVRIGGVFLDYLEEQKQFYGEVNTPDAKAGNVRVD